MTPDAREDDLRSDRLEQELEPYNEEQREAFRSTYRDALAQFGDEGRAIEVAHAAAKGTPGDR